MKPNVGSLAAVAAVKNPPMGIAAGQGKQLQNS